MTLRVVVPVEEGDYQLFGDDPYRSARSWHEAWMKSLERITQLKRALSEIAELAEVGEHTGGAAPIARAALAAVETDDSGA